MSTVNPPYPRVSHPQIQPTTDGNFDLQFVESAMWRADSIFIEKKFTYKWTHAIQTHVGSPVYRQMYIGYERILRHFI